MQKSPAKFNSDNQNIKDYLVEEKAQQAKINLLKQIPAFGYDNLVSNIAYLQFLQYFGDRDAREKTGYSLSSDYLETVVKKDPRFVRAYFLLAPASSIFAGQPEKTVEQLEIALKHIKPSFHPHSYYLWVYKAVDELMLLDRVSSAENSYKMAAKWAREINTPRSIKSAQNIEKTAKFVANNPKGTIGKIGAWTLVLSSTNDLKTQTKAIENIKALGGKIFTDSNGNFQVKVPDDAT